MADQQTGKQDPGAIRRDIEETRLRMEQNIHTLQRKLDPDRLKFEAKNKIREQTVGRVEDLAGNATDTVKGTGADVFDSIKQNPLPAALAAIGLGWLFMESRNTARQRPQRRFSTGRSYYGERYGDRYDWYDENPNRGEADPGYDYEGGRGRTYQRGATDRLRERGSDLRDNAGQMAGQAREGMRQTASNVTDKASEVASNVGDKASQVAGTVGDTASQVASNVSDTAVQVADTAQRTAYQAKTRFEEVLDENPLLIGAAALALGAAIGMSLPHTPQEDQFLGEARDRFMDKAQDTAETTMDKVQQVAQRAGDAAKDAAKDEAQKQNLTSGGNS